MKKRSLCFLLSCLLVFSLAGCGQVPLEEQNRSMPLGHLLGEDAPGQDSHLYEKADLYGLNGTAGYHYLSGKLYAFTFSTVPGDGIVSQSYDSLLKSLTDDFGKPSSTSEDGVSLWSGTGLANTITLTSHDATTAQAGYVSLTFCGKYDTLTALSLVPDALSSEFEEETTLSSLLDRTTEEVLASLPSPTERSLDESLTGSVIYEQFRLGSRVGVLSVSFYEDRSYSALFSLSSVTGSCTPEDYYDLTALARHAHKAPKQDYCLGYAAEDGVSQTQYQMWQNVNNQFTAELIYYTSGQGDVLQYSLTSSWMLNNRPAMQAVMGD